MATKKDRRQSGYTTPLSTLKCKKQTIIQNCLEPQEFYDDWKDWRDGMRDRRGDLSLLKFDKDLRMMGWDKRRTIANKKLKKMIAVRKARQQSDRNMIRQQKFNSNIRENWFVNDVELRAEERIITEQILQTKTE